MTESYRVRRARLIDEAEADAKERADRYVSQLGTTYHQQLKLDLLSEYMPELEGKYGIELDAFRYEVPALFSTAFRNALIDRGFRHVKPKGYEKGVMFDFYWEG